MNAPATEQLAALFAQVPSRPVSSFTPEELELADAILSRAGRPGTWDDATKLAVITATIDELAARNIVHLSPEFLAGERAGVDVADLVTVARAGKAAVALLAAHHAELQRIDDRYYAR